MHGDEGLQCREPLPGRKRPQEGRSHAEGRRTVARLPGDRKKDVLRRELEVADREPDVAPPDVDDRRAAAIIGGVHAQVVLLAKAPRNRKHPVRPLLVGAALVGPERGLGVAGTGGDRVDALPPGLDDDGLRCRSWSRSPGPPRPVATRRRKRSPGSSRGRLPARRCGACGRFRWNRRKAPRRDPRRRNPCALRQLSAPSRKRREGRSRCDFPRRPRPRGCAAGHRTRSRCLCPGE